MRRAPEALRFVAQARHVLAKAKLAGRWIDRTEQRNTNVQYVVSDKPMSDEEWTETYVTELHDQDSREAASCRRRRNAKHLPTSVSIGRKPPEANGSVRLLY